MAHESGSASRQRQKQLELGRAQHITTKMLNLFSFLVKKARLSFGKSGSIELEL